MNPPNTPQIPNTPDSIRSFQRLNNLVEDGVWNNQSQTVFDYLSKNNPSALNSNSLPPTTNQPTNQTTPPSTTNSTNTNTQSSGGNTQSGSNPTTDSNTLHDYQPPSETTDEANLRKAQDDYQAEADRVRTSLEGIQNGTIPLDSGQLAQIEGLKQQFQQIIDQQKLTNTGAEGEASVRGYQTGSAEYDPNFQPRIIGSIVTAGLNKVADLNIKMSAAVAALTQSFKDNNALKVKEAWAIYSDASKERQAAIQKTIDNTQKHIKEFQDKQQKITDDINAILLEAKKNGADTVTANKIAGSKSVSEAITNASDYLQSASGELGNYLQYKRETMQKGLTPMMYEQWKDKQDAKQARLDASKAYDNAYASAKGKADAERATTVDGSNGEFAATVDQVANMESTVAGKEKVKADIAKYIANGDYKSAYNQIANTVENGLTGTAKTNFSNARTDYEVMKGLKDAIQKYADGGGDMGLLTGKTEQIKRKLGIGSGKESALATQLWREFQTYRLNMTGAAFSAAESADYASVNPTLGKSLDLNLSVIDGALNALQNRVDGTINARVPSAKYISDYANARDRINDYVKNHPETADTISQLYNVPGAKDEDILKYINMIDGQ